MRLNALNQFFSLFNLFVLVAYFDHIEFVGFGFMAKH